MKIFLLFKGLHLRAFPMRVAQSLFKEKRFKKNGLIISMSDIIILYVATSLSVISRCVFMSMLYVNKSTKSLSLLMCVLGISSSCMWIFYSIENENMPLIVRSSLEISLQSISAVYIIRNKLRQYYSEKKISCDQNSVTIMQLSPDPIISNTQRYHLAVDAG